MLRRDYKITIKDADTDCPFYVEAHNAKSKRKAVMNAMNLVKSEYPSRKFYVDTVTKEPKYNIDFPDGQEVVMLILTAINVLVVIGYVIVIIFMIHRYLT